MFVRSLLHKIISFFVVMGLLFTPAAPTVRATGPQANSLRYAQSASYVPDVVIVEVKEGVSLSAEPSGSRGRRYQTNSTLLDAALSSLAVSSVTPLLTVGQANQLENRSRMASPLTRTYKIRLQPAADINIVVTELSANPDIVFAEPDYIAYPADLPALDYAPAASPLSSPRAVNQLTIDDPLYNQQWGLAKMNIESAWSATYGNPTIIVAVIDSGIDLTHIDLAGNLWVNPGEIAGNGLDDDSNGLIDDINGWNFVYSNNDVWDDNGHGTLVSGVAAAIGGNGQGIVGVCPQCSIMPVKVMQASGAANYSDIAAGVLYAAQKGAKVINLSLGGYANSNTLRNAIDTAVNTYGVVVVAGAGNDNLNQAFYPAAYDNVLAVAGTAEDDTKLGFSNYAAWVDISAPAVDIRTTALGGDWANSSGTSAASPFAAGLAGLLRTLHPDWNQATIRSQIVHTTDSIESVNPTYAGMLGSGRLNAEVAMQVPHPLISMTGYTVNGLADGRPILGVSAQLNVTLGNDWWNALGVIGTLSTTDSFATITNANASYGDIPAATSKTNATAFSFSVDSGAGYNHPIPFTLAVTDTSGYSNSFNFTVNTETGVVNKSGTLTTDTWTNDKSYLITNNISIPTGNTLTIQPGTVIKFNGNYTLSVRGTLIADGTSDQPIQFKSNTAGTWDKIFFDDLNIDALADVDGNYLSGSILRYVNVEGNTGGIICTSATPYLSHVNLNNGGITCALGATPIWFLDNTIVGNVSFTGPGNAYHNTISGGLSISEGGIAEDNVLGGSLSVGSGSARRNTITGGGLTVGGTAGSIDENSVTGGNISAGSTFSVTNNIISGSLNAGDSSTVDHNTVSGGITAGSSVIVTWNNVEGASGVGLTAGSNVTAQYNLPVATPTPTPGIKIGVGLTAGSNVTAQYNRLIGNTTGMIASTGLIEHNLIANNTGVGLQVGAAIVRYNTFTGNAGNTIVVQGGTSVTIGYNNLEGNTGTYDLYLNIPGGVFFVPAEHNWWGTTDDLVIADRIYDWNDDDTKATASYTLKATTPDQTAPAYVRSVTVLPDATLGIQTGTFDVVFSRPMDEGSNPAVEFFSTKKDTWQTYNTSNSGLANNEVRTIAEDTAGNTWFGTWGSGISVLRADGTWQTYNTSNSGLANNQVYAIAMDVARDIWFGTWGGGVSVLRADGTWQTYNTSNSGLANNQVVYAIAMDVARNIWFSTWGSGVSVLRANGTWQTYNTSNSGLASDEVGSIAVDAAGTKWFSTYSGVSVLRVNGTWQTYNTSNSGLTNDMVSSIAVDAVGNKWFGTQGSGVSVLRADGTWQTYNTSNSGLASNIVNAIAADAAGNKWVGTFYGVSVLRAGGTWQTYNTSNSGLASDGIGPIALDAAGTKWFGAWGVGVSVQWGATEYPIIDNRQWPSFSLYRASYDITSAIPKATYRVSLSNALDPDGIRVAPFSNVTFTVEYAGFISDKTPPTQPIATASGDGSLTSISASWSSSDPESPITQYRYAIGTTPGGREVVAWTYISIARTSVTRTGLNLTSGQVYYVTVGARNEGGLWSDDGVSNGVIAGVVPYRIYLPLASR